MLIVLIKKVYNEEIVFMTPAVSNFVPFCRTLFSGFIFKEVSEKGGHATNFRFSKKLRNVYHYYTI